MAGVNQINAELINGGGFANAGYASNADAVGLSCGWQDGLQQPVRNGPVGGAVAFDQGDGLREDATIAAGEAGNELIC